MDDARFVTRIRCAAAAGWWTSLIAILWLSVGWCLWIAMTACPSGACARWIEYVWGGMTISEARPIVWIFFGAMKMMIIPVVLASIFLTIWAKRLKKAE